MKRNISFLILFIVILIGLLIIMPGRFKKSLEFLQDTWQGSIGIWNSNVQPFINKLKLNTEEKIGEEKPKIEKEFKKEIQEMKAETFKTGKSLFKILYSFIKR